MLNKVNFTLSQLAAFDIFQGYTNVGWDPRVNYFLLGKYRKVNIYNLDKTYFAIKGLVNVISDLLAKKGRIWIVNENFDLFERNTLLRNLKSNLTELWFHNDKWTKGCLTNFRFVDRFEWSKFPHLIFVPNILNNQFVVNECFCIKIPSVGLVDTSDNPTRVFYPIPSNSRSLMPLFFFYLLIAKLVSHARNTVASSFLFNSYRRIFLVLVRLLKPVIRKEVFFYKNKKTRYKKRRGFRVKRYFVNGRALKDIKWLELFFGRYNFLLHHLKFLTSKGKFLERFLASQYRLDTTFGGKYYFKKRKKKSQTQLLKLKRDFLSWNVSSALAGHLFTNSLYSHFFEFFKDDTASAARLPISRLFLRILNV